MLFWVSPNNEKKYVTFPTAFSFFSKDFAKNFPKKLVNIFSCVKRVKSSKQKVELQKLQFYIWW